MLAILKYISLSWCIIICLNQTPTYSGDAGFAWDVLCERITSASDAQGSLCAYVDTMPTLALGAPSISLASGGTHLVTTGRFLIYSEEFFKNFYSCISSCVLLHQRVIFSSRQKRSMGYAFPFEDLRAIQPQTAVVSSHRHVFPLLTKMHEPI